ncbi:MULTISPECIES: Sec-independent protein translocase protein TatB [unclassified Moraxella]|uniref:Sec-independent protein translocase protein TatB n=1 Tax=unclassified Moraxella TaxID=2685852 RepID=UPI003AF92897
MFDIGFSELLIFGAIALVVLGPEKLPQAVRTAGRYYAKFRRTVATLQSEIEAELDLAETRKQMQEEFAKIKQAEDDMKKEMEALRASMQEMQQQGNVPKMETAFNQPTAINTDLPNDLQADQIAQELSHAVLSATNPMYNQWFLLGDYDQAKRLPNAPFLPNYQADTLLNQSATLATGGIDG